MIMLYLFTGILAMFLEFDAEDIQNCQECGSNERPDNKTRGTEYDYATQRREKNQKVMHPCVVAYQTGTNKIINH
jgi:hypothetical protein